MKNKFYGKNILITGGSSGIGLATAIEFAKLKARLFLLARNPSPLKIAEQKIRDITGESAMGIECDVSRIENVQKSVCQIAEGFGGIHAVIANAGSVHVEKFSTLPLLKMHEIMNVNYWGAVNLIHTAWPYLEKSKGNIGMVSSVAGYVGIIGYSAYSPTKFAMTGLAQSLRAEAKTAGIGVTIIYPPDTDTPQLAEENKNMIPELEKMKKYASILPPEKVAKKLVEGMMNNKFEVFCNWQSKCIRCLLAFWPTLA